MSEVAELLLELDQDGYPTDASKAAVKVWPGSYAALLAAVRKIWQYADLGYWREVDGEDDLGRPVRRYHVSTGGWSGNETLVSAMEDNSIFWIMSWQSSARGGHYVFEVSLKGAA